MGGVSLEGRSASKLARLWEDFMRKMQWLALAMAWVIIGLLAVACQSDSQAQSTPAAAPSPPTSGATNSAAGASATPRVIPTAAQDKGVVHGILLEVDTKQPLSEVKGVDVFLGAILRSGDNAQSLASLDKNTAPRADPDANGRFVFADVPPGEYALVVRSPVSEVVARKLDQSGDVIVTVVAGQALDLGEVYSKYP
jgi:hypothetical protein